jgi:hypothetical protein
MVQIKDINMVYEQAFPANHQFLASLWQKIEEDDILGINAFITYADSLLALQKTPASLEIAAHILEWDDYRQMISLLKERAAQKNGKLGKDGFRSDLFLIPIAGETKALDILLADKEYRKEMASSLIKFNIARNHSRIIIFPKPLSVLAVAIASPHEIREILDGLYDAASNDSASGLKKAKITIKGLENAVKNDQNLFNGSLSVRFALGIRLRPPGIRDALDGEGYDNLQEGAKALEHIIEWTNYFSDISKKQLGGERLLAAGPFPWDEACARAAINLIELIMGSEAASLGIIANEEGHELNIFDEGHTIWVAKRIEDKMLGPVPISSEIVACDPDVFFEMLQEDATDVIEHASWKDMARLGSGSVWN